MDKLEVLIAITVREKRKNRGMTQAELAERVGVSRTYVADIEAGRYTPSVKVLSKLAEALSFVVVITERTQSASNQ